jgi:hypothetical protein
MISPRVFATWVTESVGNGLVQLPLLVLWRGAPSWFSAPGGF